MENKKTSSVILIFHFRVWLISFSYTHDKSGVWMFSDEGCDDEQVVPELEVRRVWAVQQLEEERLLQRSEEKDQLL